MCTCVYQSRDLLTLDARTLRDFVTPTLTSDTHMVALLVNDGQQTTKQRQGMQEWEGRYKAQNMSNDVFWAIGIFFLLFLFNYTNYF